MYGSFSNFEYIVLFHWNYKSKNTLQNNHHIGGNVIISDLVYNNQKF